MISKLLRTMSLDNDFDLPAEFGPYVNLVRIELRERTLASSRSSYGDGDMKGPGKLGKHDYILLTVIDGYRRLFSFVAEKMKQPRLCGGKSSYVHLIPLREFSMVTTTMFRARDNQDVSSESNRIQLTTGHQYNLTSDNRWSVVTRFVEADRGLCLLQYSSAYRSRFVWELDTPIVSTVALNEILTSNGSRYSAISDNCWSYASQAVEAVVGLCKEARGYEEAVQRLEKVKRPLPRDFLRLGYKPVSRKNPDTLRRIYHWVASSFRSDTNVHGDLITTTRRPSTRDVFRLFYKPFSRKNPATLSRIVNWEESSFLFDTSVHKGLIT